MTECANWTRTVQIPALPTCVHRGLSAGHRSAVVDRRVRRPGNGLRHCRRRVTACGPINLLFTMITLRIAHP